MHTVLLAIPAIIPIVRANINIWSVIEWIFREVLFRYIQLVMWFHTFTEDCGSVHVGPQMVTTIKRRRATQVAENKTFCSERNLRICFY